MVIFVATELNKPTTEAIENLNKALFRLISDGEKKGENILSYKKSK